MSMINPESNIIIIIIIIIIILHYHPIMSILSRTTITNVLQSPHDHDHHHHQFIMTKIIIAMQAHSCHSTPFL